MDFLISKSASHVSSSLQSDLASLCNNIQREDNCWVHAHGLALIFKTGHGTAEMRPVSLMAVVQADYLQWDRSGNGVVLSGGNAEEDNYVLIFFFFLQTGEPWRDARAIAQEQSSSHPPGISTDAVMERQFLANDKH